MTFKEKYLSSETFDTDISLIYNELKENTSKKKQWVGTLEGSALIVTDFQDYFLRPVSHAFIPSAPALIPNIKLLTHFFRKYGRPVIFTRHVNNNENSAAMGYWWNDLLDEEHGFSRIYDGLTAQGDDILVKNQYDAFYKTNLESTLHAHGVLYPVICGVMTNLCCETTVRSAFVRGFRPVLPLDTTATYNRLLHLSTFRNLSFGFCPAMTMAEVMKILEKHE